MSGRENKRQSWVGVGETLDEMQADFRHGECEGRGKMIWLNRFGFCTVIRETEGCLGKCFGQKCLYEESHVYKNRHQLKSPQIPCGDSIRLKSVAFIKHSDQVFCSGHGIVVHYISSHLAKEAWFWILFSNKERLLLLH